MSQSHTYVRTFDEAYQVLGLTAPKRKLEAGRKYRCGRQDRTGDSAGCVQVWPEGDRGWVKNYALDQYVVVLPANPQDLGENDRRSISKRLTDQQKTDKAELLAEHKVVAAFADQLYNAFPSVGDHPYLSAKQITVTPEIHVAPADSVNRMVEQFLAKEFPERYTEDYVLQQKHFRLWGSKGAIEGSALIVPLRDADGKIWSLEFIAGNGSKGSLKFGRTFGCFFAAGLTPEGTLITAERLGTPDAIVVAEGLATMQACLAGLAAAKTGLRILGVECRSHGNYAPVLKALQTRCRMIIVASDVTDDGRPDSKTVKSCLVAGVGFVIPDLGADLLAKGATDFNDWLVALQAKGLSPAPIGDLIQKKIEAQTSTLKAMDLEEPKKALSARLKTLEDALDISVNGRYALRFETFSQTLQLCEEGHPWRLLEDHDVVALISHFTRHLGFAEIPVKKMWDAVTGAAYANRIDLMQARLSGLPTWDGVERCAAMMSTYCGVKESPYSRAFGIYLMTALYARASATEEVQADICPVLYSARQGIGKTTFVKKLAMDPSLYTEICLDALDLDEERYKLPGHVVVEVSELCEFRRQSNEVVKAFISAASDNVRMKWQRMPMVRPRRCVMIGTTNRATFLTDPTGNRRYAVLEVGDIWPHMSQFENDLPQLWAEAKVLVQNRVKEGKPPVDHSELETLARKANLRFYARDCWTTPIQAYLKGHGPTSIRMLLDRAVRVRPERQTPQVQRRVRDILATLNCRKGLGADSEEEFSLGS